MLNHVTSACSPDNLSVEEDDLVSRLLHLSPVSGSVVYFTAFKEYFPHVLQRQQQQLNCHGLTVHVYPRRWREDDLKIYIFFPGYSSQIFKMFIFLIG